MTKILQYDKIQYQLTDQEALDVSNFLSRRDRPTHFIFKGKSLMARKMEVLDEGHENKPAFMEYYWTDEELERFENEIFPQFKTFEEYLISENVWIINDKYPTGAIRDPKRYRELNVKWVSLQTFRYKQNPTKTIEVIDKIKAKLIGKMSVEESVGEGMGNAPSAKGGTNTQTSPNPPKEDNPIQKPEKVIQHDIGCEIQHTGKCNCKEPNYEQKPEEYKSTKEPEDGVVEVSKIPF